MNTFDVAYAIFAGLTGALTLVKLVQDEERNPSGLIAGIFSVVLGLPFLAGMLYGGYHGLIWIHEFYMGLF